MSRRSSSNARFGFSPTQRVERRRLRLLADGVVVGRVFRAAASPEGSPWMWTLAFRHHEDRTPTHGCAPMREAAMAALG
jgi:hypothetical protein